MAVPPLPDTDEGPDQLAELLCTADWAHDPALVARRVAGWQRRGGRAARRRAVAKVRAACKKRDAPAAFLRRLRTPRPASQGPTCARVARELLPVAAVLPAGIVVARVMAAFRSLSTQRECLHELQRALAASGASPERVRALRLPREVVRQAHRDYKNAIRAHADHRTDVSMDAVFEICHDWLFDDTSPARRFAALCLVSGRRCVEVFCRGAFAAPTAAQSATFPGGSEPFLTQFTGSAKRRPGRRTPTVAVVPLLVPRTVFYRALLRLREEVSGTCAPLDAVSEDCGGVLPAWTARLQTAACREVEARLGKGATVKTLRGVYAVVSHELFFPRETVNRWTTRVLGHASERTVFSYINYRLLPRGVGAVCRPVHPR